MPKRISLPSKLPPACSAVTLLIDAELGDQRVTGLLDRQRHGDPGDEEHRHRRPERPALPGVADHLAEGVDEPGRNGEDGQHLEEVGQRVRVLVGMGRVGVEEAAAVGAELLDASWQATGPWAMVWVAPFERRRVTCRGSGSAARPARRAPARRRRRSAAGRRGCERTRSTQKLPMALAERRARPRTRAMAMAMPVAAETKLWTASPAIWVR